MLVREPPPLPLLALLLLASSAVAKPPHIVIYLSDDHSQFDSELYGATDIPTPNFVKLAAAGMTFTHAFVASPSCAPSRAAMLTGLMPARNGAEANHTYPRANTHYLIDDLKSYPANDNLAPEIETDHLISRRRSEVLSDIENKIRSLATKALNASDGYDRVLSTIRRQKSFSPRF